MALLSKPSSSAYASLLYITVGVLIQIWSGIWYWYLSNNTPENPASWYWCYGFLLTGLALLVIGLLIGQIGRAARHAELPPPDATPAEANIQHEAAAHTPIVLGPNAAAPPLAVPPATQERVVSQPR
jgi:hypothetical protein